MDLWRRHALVDAGWRITVSTPSAAIASGVPAESLAPLLVRLGRGDARYRPLCELFAMGEGGTTLVHLTSGAEEFVEADLVVVQTGREPAPVSQAPFAAAGIAVHAIGDCVAPRRISHALLDAHRLAGAL